MRLDDLLQFLPGYRVAVAGNPEVHGLAYDSREVRSGDLFVAWRGLRFDGHHFVGEALARGAVGAVVETEVDTAGLPQVVVPDGRQALALLAAAFWSYPSRRMRLVGVTGTNGKTTTTHLCKAILERAGRRVGLIGTIRHLIGDEVLEAHRTTPESLDLQRLLFQMAGRGMDSAVMEVSSHAVALRRIVGCEFDVGVFTNITQDHLDFHGSFEQYLEAKAAFFDMLGREATKAGKAAAVNGDDPHGPAILARCAVPVLTYGLGAGAQVRATQVAVAPGGVSYTAETPQGSLSLRLRLTGRFNVYNSLAALCVGLIEGVPLEAIKAGLEGVRGVPGRLERVDQGQDFTVLVDYAHTPDSLENVLSTVRGFAQGKVWVVFGCGGDRDRTKRPIMGTIAAHLADRVIVTSDNPRSEDPEKICREVEEGVRRAGKNAADCRVIVDRREAIATAIRTAAPGDVVLIAGKGHETYQIFPDRTIHFDDREEAAIALKERLAHGTHSA